MICYLHGFRQCEENERQFELEFELALPVFDVAFPVSPFILGKNIAAHLHGLINPISVGLDIKYACQFVSSI